MDCELTAARTEGNQTSCGWTHVLLYIAAWTQCDKKKTITWAGSKWTIWLLVTLWNSCNLAAGLLVASYHSALQQSQFDSLAAWRNNNNNSSLVSWLYDSLLLGCLAGRITAEQETKKKCNHHYQTSIRPNYVSPIKKSGSAPWTSLDRGFGSKAWILTKWNNRYLK